jgi:penicillin-binding protein 1A
VGFDDPQPLGWGESGAVTALSAWMALMKIAHDKRPATEFPRPGSIVTVSVDPGTGLLAREGQSEGIEEEFLDGTAPSEVAPEIVEVPDGGLPEAGTDEDLASQGAGSLPEVPQVPLVPVSGEDAGEPAPPF